MSRPVLALVGVTLFAGWSLDSQAHCVLNRSSARLSVDVSAGVLGRLQGMVEPYQQRCFPLDANAEMRVEAVQPPVYGLSIIGRMSFSATTSSTKIRVTEKRRFEAYGERYMELGFCRDC